MQGTLIGLVLACLPSGSIIIHNIASPSCYDPVIRIYKNEVGCRDDTMQKNCRCKKALRGGVRVCNNLPQPPKTKM